MRLQSVGMSTTASDSLDAALARHGIALPDAARTMLDRYARLLWDWNTKLNLTRHTDYDKFVSRDVIDTLAFSRHLTAGEDVLDVGTGGGVPGVVLAILRPDVSVTLCDSVGKKARAVESILAELGLDVAVYAAPVQQLFEEEHTFDVLVVRAVARLEKLLKWFNPFWGQFHRLLILKGPNWPDERRVCREQRLIQHLDLRKLESYAIPGTGAESVLLQLMQKQA